MENSDSNLLYIPDECFNVWLVERRKRSETGELYFKIVNVITKAHESKITGIYNAFNKDLQIPFLFTTSFDKNVKLWNLKEAPALSGTYKGLKKITEALLTADGKTAIFADKFGDVFTFDVEDLSFKNKELKANLAIGNLSTVNCLSLVSYNDKNYLLVSDEYHRTKVCSYPNIYKIENVIIPHLACVKQMQEYKDYIIILYKFVDNYYQIYLMMKDKLLADKDHLKNLNILDIKDKDIKKVKIIRCGDKLAVLKIKEHPVLEIYKTEETGAITKLNEYLLSKSSKNNKLYLLKSTDNLNDIIVVEAQEEKPTMEEEIESHEKFIGAEAFANPEGLYDITPGIKIHVFPL